VAQLEDYDVDANQYRLLVRGTDASSNMTWGFVIVTLDPDAMTISVEDDPGVTNPIVTNDELAAVLEGRYSADSIFILRGIKKCYDGSYTWFVGVHRGGQDNNLTVALPGGTETELPDAPLVWNTFGFSAKEQEPHPHGGSVGMVGSEEFEVMTVIDQPYGETFQRIASGRIQEWPFQVGNAMRTDARRPQGAVLTVDGRSWSGFSCPNTPVVPFAVKNYTTHYNSFYPYSAEVYGRLGDRAAPAPQGLDWHATDNRGFSLDDGYTVDNSEFNGYAMPLAILANEKRLLAIVKDHAGSDNMIAYACPYRREAWVDLSGSETSGYLVTPALKKPTGGWEELYISSAMNDGDITVDILDPLSGNVAISGYKSADCDTISGSDREEVTWGGNSMSELDDAYDYLRLKITITRPDGGDDSPELYEWYCGGALTKNSISSSGRSGVSKTTSSLMSDQVVSPSGFEISSTVDATSSFNTVIVVSTSNNHNQRPMRLEGPIAVQVQISADGTNGSWKDYGPEVRMTVRDDTVFELPEAIQYARVRVRNTDTLNITVDIDATVSE
jgi:hypothetical protein